MGRAPAAKCHSLCPGLPSAAPSGLRKREFVRGLVAAGLCGARSANGHAARKQTCPAPNPHGDAQPQLRTNARSPFGTAARPSTCLTRSFRYVSMYLLHNPVREYAWGSHTALAELLGEPAPSAVPQAELWMGAHPLAPSCVCDEHGVPGQGLDACIAAAPERWLGKAVAARFAGELPFLFKVLACAQPLSLQAHPSEAQATTGFAREEAAGVPRDAPERTYKDARHKPELICALTRFVAWCGFREPGESCTLLRELDCAALKDACAPLHDTTEATAQGDATTLLSATTQSLLTLPAERCAHLVAETARACSSYVARQPSGPFATACAWVPALAQRYPHDPGVVLTLLINLVELAPGEALFLPAGTLHAYAEGVGVEIMANSDNVLRGGLTQKYVDVAELLRILSFRPGGAQPVATQRVSPGLFRYLTPNAEEFALYRLEANGEATLPEELAGAPAVVLVTHGHLTLTDASARTLPVQKGRAAYLPPDAGRVVITGSATAYLATTPHTVCSGIRKGW